MSERGRHDSIKKKGISTTEAVRKHDSKETQNNDKTQHPRPRFPAAAPRTGPIKQNIRANSPLPCSTETPPPILSFGELWGRRGGGYGTIQNLCPHRSKASTKVVSLSWEFKRKDAGFTANSTSAAEPRTQPVLRKGPDLIQESEQRLKARSGIQLFLPTSALERPTQAPVHFQGSSREIGVV